MVLKYSMPSSTSADKVPQDFRGSLKVIFVAELKGAMQLLLAGASLAYNIPLNGVFVFTFKTMESLWQTTCISATTLSDSIWFC